MTNEFEYDAFLSYSRMDYDIANTLACRLREDGIRIWFDEWMIKRGDLISLKIEEGLTRSRNLILVMSQHALNSEWVTLERHTAVFRDPTNRGERRFIPLLADDVTLPDMIRQYSFVDWREKSPEEYRSLREIILEPTSNPLREASSRDVEVKISMAVSVDGFIDDALPTKLVLSNSRDWDQVDIMRSWCDAILVGANALRKDNPRLLIRNEHRQQERISQGRSANPVKVTLSKSGDLDETSSFFRLGTERKLIYCTPSCAGSLSLPIKELAELRILEPVTAKAVLVDLAKQGLKRLMIEGGTQVASLFLKEGLVDEMRLAVAPFFIGDDQAPRLVSPGVFPHRQANPMKLSNIEMIEGMAILQYELKRLD